MSYIGNQPTSTAFVTDTFSGNGTTTAFTMSVAPAGTTSLLVAITGVVQDPSAYSVTGTTLTFSSAPPSGTGNISVRYLGIPASGVTTTAYRTVTEFTATAGQTTFTPPSYTVGYLNVYRNGVLLGSADYTATNGTTVVLAAAASAGDLVTTESFYVSSVLNALPTSGGTLNGNLNVIGDETVTGNTYLATSSGNVGVGTTSPSYKLHVYEGGGVLVRPTASGSTNQVDWHAANAGTDMFMGCDNSSGSITGTAYGGYLYNQGNTPITFHTNSTRQMTIAADGTITGTKGNLQLISGTAVASTSGTAIDFTNIPSWVKRITIMFGGVSISGSAHLLVQAGVSSTPTTSGYNSTSSYATASASSTGGASSTAGFIMYIGVATYNFSGHIVLTNVSGNLWVSSGLIANSTTTPYTGQQAGNVTLGGTLGMVRITTSNGTDTFDAGSINIMYE